MSFDAVFFDCDSTLCKVEGIDALAERAPADVRERVVSATKRAMDGEIPLEQVYAERLDALRPTKAQLDKLGDLYVRELVPGVRETIGRLQRASKHVGIVSGGLLHAVRILAANLGITDRNVHAVDCTFDANGDFVGHVPGPLARSGGKVEILRAIRSQFSGGLAFVGDGITDLEAAGAVDRFIGFGGVARRQAVVDGAGAYYVDGPSLEQVLDHIL